MATVYAPIVFAIGQDRDSSELGGASGMVSNAIPDATGTMRQRPAISTWNLFPNSGVSRSPVIGIGKFRDYLVYVTADRYIHAISPTGYIEELSPSDYMYSKLDGDDRPVMVAGYSMIAIAGGGAIQKWGGVLPRSERLAPTALEGERPPSSASICAIARRLIAQPNDDSGEMWWSGPLDAWEDWDLTTAGGASYVQVAAKPDKLVAIRDNGNEVFAWGPETLQVFAPSSLAVDPNDPYNLLDFSTVRTKTVGTLSPHSIVALDDTFAFLDSKRRFVISDGREMKVISKGVGSQLAGLAKVSDCWGFRLRLGRVDALVWIFPEDNVGLIWDSATGNWSEWREGDDGNGPITITSAFDWAEQGLFLVGRSDGSIAKLDPEAHADGSGPIVVDIRSGFSDRGTPAPKACNGVTFTFRRTWEDLPPLSSTGLTASGRVRIYYRDYPGAWRLAKEARLSSEKRPVVVVRSLGVYQSRQWRVLYGGEDRLQLVSAQEELETLEAA
jgi:hypothetical protein